MVAIMQLLQMKRAATALAENNTASDHVVCVHEMYV
jgi:hypothetical protein